VKSITDLDRERGEATAEESLTVKDTQIKRIDAHRLDPPADP
jgi:hypothetical protein